MSIRTALEINHDHLDVLLDPEAMAWLKMYLASGDAEKIDSMRHPYGIKFLGQRHHSEPEFKIQSILKDKP